MLLSICTSQPKLSTEAVQRIVMAPFYSVKALSWLRKRLKQTPAV